jgi:hypothetical protein
MMGPSRRGFKMIEEKRNFDTPSFKRVLRGLGVLQDGITMYNISIPIRKKKFQFHGILTWTIHDALGITHFCGI